MSPKHSVFVLDRDGKPLTPTTSTKARKMMSGGVAKPVWNKFGQFGIQMLVDTRKEKPKIVLGIDFGTKFEGYSLVTGKENNLAVMWKLPNKKNIVRKLEERKDLRKRRRYQNCRRREAKFNNRSKNGFLAPSQRVMMLSRLKAIGEFFKCYPIDIVALEDVKFNHHKKWGFNFSTIEIGKTKIYNWIKQKSNLKLFSGYDTQNCRVKYGYKKSGNKSAELFNAHCSDALAIATDVYAQENIIQGKFIVVDDTYRPVRRRLHDTRFSISHVRYLRSTGNFKSVRKGTICEIGLICGGKNKENCFSIYPFKEKNGKEKRIWKSMKKILWLSHKFKMVKMVG
jgi:hypothetical protein